MNCHALGGACGRCSGAAGGPMANACQSGSVGSGSGFHPWWYRGAYSRAIMGCRPGATPAAPWHPSLASPGAWHRAPDRGTITPEPGGCGCIPGGSAGGTGRTLIGIGSSNPLDGGDRPSSGGSASCARREAIFGAGWCLRAPRVRALSLAAHNRSNPGCVRTTLRRASSTA
jgi:hypothetical protein